MIICHLNHFFDFQNSNYVLIRISIMLFFNVFLVILFAVFLSLLLYHINFMILLIKTWQCSCIIIVFDTVDSMNLLVFIIFKIIFQNMLVNMNLMMIVNVVTQQYNAINRNEIKNSSHEKFLLNAILIWWKKY